MTIDDVHAAFDKEELGEENVFGPPTAEMKACASEIFEYFPPLDDIPEEEDSIYTIDPRPIEGYIGLCLSWSTPKKSLDKLLRITHKHGFAMYNPQDDQLIIPDTKDTKDTLIGRVRSLFLKKKDH
ncbi:MAG: hypothetical protein JKY43_03695 [Phycisphaerales bacterium]|nr:hypothetical protein [Phycisphaerales bacterium]